MLTETQSRDHYPHICCTTILGDLFCNWNILVSTFTMSNFYIDLALPDLSKLIGEEWKNMTDD